MKALSNSISIAKVQQQRLGDYCRTGRYRPIRGTKPGRIRQYRDLVYNVIDDALRAAYPLTEQLLSAAEWEKMSGDFIRLHRCESAQVWKLPSELFAFMSGHPHPLKGKYPHLTTLLYFEWEEIALFMMEDKAVPACRETGDLLRDVLVVNPEHKLLKLEYPVHLKSAKSIREPDKGEYFVLLHRDRQSGRINFLALSTYYVWLLEGIVSGRSVADLLAAGAELFCMGIPGLKERSASFLQELKRQDFISGFKQNH